MGVTWDVVLGTGVWLLWRWRNKVVFGEEWISKDDMYFGLLQKEQDFPESMQMEISVQANRSSVLKQVGWFCPENSW